MPQEKNQMKEIWRKFIQRQEADYSILRPEIIESWTYCRECVNPYIRKNDIFITNEEMIRLREKNRDLLEIVIPVMKRLYSIVEGSGFAIHFGLIEGDHSIAVELIGDPNALALSANVNAVPGSVWSEESMGTQAASMALKYKRPFQIMPYENWCEALQNGTTSAVPIFDPDSGKMIAGLMMGASSEKVHPHTLGMVVAAADSIERQLAQQRMKRILEIENRYKSLLMESISDGLIATDDKEVVTHINSNAKRLFGLNGMVVEENLWTAVKRSMSSLDGCKDFIGIVRAKEEFTDEFISLRSPNKQVRGTVTTRYLNSGEGETLGKMIIISDMARVSSLTSKTFGHTAHTTFNDLIGEDEKFLQCIEMSFQAARSNSTVLLLGESGTGKDLFAQSIHNASARHNKPYIAINCAAIPRDLFGSELFGYSEGAFTGAKRGGNPGKFELADGGTLFLDEIGMMPLEMQSILLRIIEDKKVTRIGGKEIIPVDVRIIAATNKDLNDEVSRGMFRADLFYRLNVMSIKLPPLRQRKGDIALLVMHFIDKISEKLGKKIEIIDAEVMMALTLYDWPGNIRELQNNIERMINMVKGTTIDADLLPENIEVISNERMKDPNLSTLREYGKSIEQSMIHFYIYKNNGNASGAAREMGISRSTLYRKLGKTDNS